MYRVIVLIALINFCAAFVQASAGFGYALISMAFMPFLLPMQSSSAVCAATCVAIGVQMVLSLRKHIRLRLVLVPVLCCFVTINAGLWMLNHFPELVLRCILAAVLLLVTAVFAHTRRKSVSVPDTPLAGAAVGLVTGITTGMFNIVGPFLMLFYLSICDDTLELKASLEFSFLITSLYTLVNHLIVYATLDAGTLPYALAACVAALAAGFVGLRVYRKLNKEMITRFAYTLLPIMAVMLVVNAFR